MRRDREFKVEIVNVESKPSRRRRPLVGPDPNLAVDPHDKLKALRVALGFSQSEFAHLAKMDRLDVVALESGRHKGTPYKRRVALAEAFGLAVEDVAELLDGDLTVPAALLRIESRKGGGSTSLSNLEIAIAYLGDAVSKAAVDRVRLAATDPQALVPREWGAELMRVQGELLAEIDPTRPRPR